MSFQHDSLSDIAEGAKNYYLYGNSKLYRVGHKCISSPNADIPCNVMSGVFHGGLADAFWDRHSNPVLKDGGKIWNYNSNVATINGVEKTGRHTDGSIYTLDGVTIGEKEAPTNGHFYLNKYDQAINIPNKYIGRPQDVLDSDSKFTNITGVIHSSSLESYGVNINDAASNLIDSNGAMTATVHLAKGKLQVLQWDKTITVSDLSSYGGIPCDDSNANCLSYDIECNICKTRGLYASGVEEERIIFCKTTEDYANGSVDCSNFSPLDVYSNCVNGCMHGTGACADNNYDSRNGRLPDILHNCGCGEENTNCDFELLLNSI